MLILTIRRPHVQNTRTILRAFARIESRQRAPRERPLRTRDQARTNTGVTKIEEAAERIVADGASVTLDDWAASRVALSRHCSADKLAVDPSVYRMELHSRWLRKIHNSQLQSILPWY